MADIRVPVHVVATQSDHIAPWKASFPGLNRTSGAKTWILAQSGHIAGIVNPPAGAKYGHWTSKAKFKSCDQWFDSAEFHEGSWWDRWSTWLSRKSGKKIPARQPGSDAFPVIEAAPGSYVKMKAR
jgi:polyhydroxyalkanoate synthase